MKAVKDIIFVFTIVGLNSLAIAKTSSRDAQTEASGSGYCESCGIGKTPLNLTREELAEIAREFNKKPEQVRTRRVDLRNTPYLNAVGEVIVYKKGKNGKTILPKEILTGGAAGFLMSVEEDEKDCVMLTAKHQACLTGRTPDRYGNYDPILLTDEQCASPDNKITFRVGKTNHNMGPGFDYEVDGEVVAVGDEGASGDDWALVKVKKPKRAKEWPKPFKTWFPERGGWYEGLNEIISVGVPAYGGGSTLYADMGCASTPATGTGRVDLNCEISGGFSGGPLVAVDTNDGSAWAIGINSGANGIFTKEKGVVTTGTWAVSFESTPPNVPWTNAGDTIKAAYKKVRCD